MSTVIPWVRLPEVGRLQEAPGAACGLLGQQHATLLSTPDAHDHAACRGAAGLGVGRGRLIGGAWGMGERVA